MRRCLYLVWKDQRGVVLAVTLMLMGLLGALAGAYALAVRADTKLTGGAGRMRTGFYAAEAGLNVGMAEFASIFKNYGVPAESDFAQREIVVGDRTVHYQLDDVDGYAPCTEEQPDCFRTIPAGERFAGLKTIPYRYTVTSTSENMAGDEEVELGAEFDIHNVPIFQFLAFYTNDLEILPGPNMNLSGRIHTNGRLYLNSNSTLTIGDRLSPPPANPFVQVSATQGVYRGRKNDSSCGGTVIIDKLEDTLAPFGDYDPLPLPCTGGSAQVPQATLDAYKGSVIGNADFIDIPTFDTIARGGSGQFWQRADLRVVLRLDLPRQQIDFSASDLCPGGPGTLVSPPLFPIEVQDASGGRDVTKTRALWRFMCERRGAIFYTDVPTARQPSGTGGVGDGDGKDRNDYTPNFGGTVDGTSGGAENYYDPNTMNYNTISYRNYRVYRRVGEDTDGNGVIDNSDFNPDICPDDVVENPPNPWWEPSYCHNFDRDGVGGNRRGRWFEDMDYRRGGYYNHRERKWMYLLNVNVRALIEWNQVNGNVLFASDERSDGGLVFFLSVQGPNSDAAANNYGVRIFDSADLDTRDTTFPTGQADPTGLTVVSDQAIYIQGNYNYYPTQTLAQKYPAAVIGDSLNVLSQSWERPRQDGGSWRANDRKSLNSFNFRRIDAQDAPCGPSGCANNFSSATGLGINAAFIAGVDNTVGSAYNGGLENYPRFHEDWSDGSRTLVYRGSFVSLGPPQHVKGSWSYGGPVYTAPNRNWDYDADFNEVEKLPPLTPKITYVQQRLYTRFYK
jgi:hypothetical protein